MKIIKFCLILLWITAPLYGMPAVKILNVLNDTQLKIKVHVNNMVLDAAKGQNVTFTTYEPVTSVWWEEFDRHGNKMSSWTVTKPKGIPAMGEQLILNPGGLYRWIFDAVPGLANYYPTLNYQVKNASSRYKNEQLIAAEGQAAVTDFIKSQPENEQACWVFGLTNGLFPEAIQRAKNECMKQTPENQKKLVKVQFEKMSAIAKGETPPPMPPGIKEIYESITAGLNNPKVGNLQGMEELAAQAQREYEERLANAKPASVLSVLIGSNKGGAMGKIMGNLVMLALGVVLTIVTAGAGTPAIMAAAAGIAANIASTIPSLTNLGIEWQKEQQQLNIIKNNMSKF